MKKLLLILLTFMSFTSFAQMQVKENSFHQIEGFVMLDKNEHYDDNNQPMALIKISTENITAEERRRITFKGNLATYFDVHFEPTEIHLYISAQAATFLEIHHPDYGKTEFILPFDLKDFCGYEMVLQYVPIVPADIQNTSSKYNTITIIADQEDAIIYVDNEVTHDNICVKSFPVGSTHTWKIECELYHSESGDITITEGNPIVVEKKLNKAHGFLNIVSTPQNNAIIYLNDNEIGVTPFKSNKIASGIYKLKLDKESYKIIEQDVEITDGDTTNLVLNMQIDYADVTINTDSQSEIYIDGNYIGRGNWSGNLVEGKHIIESKKTHHKTIVKNIDIIAEKTEHITFEPPTLVHENIDINTEPTGEINGYEYVDLGLPSGIKWATKNVGADSPEEFGNHFFWGIGKYDIADSYEYSRKTAGYLKKNKIEKKKNRYRNRNTNVEGNKKYDMARSSFGSPWRLPSKNDFQELIDECVWIWIEQDGVNGYRVVGPNYNSIFFPASGTHQMVLGGGIKEYYYDKKGYYWTSVPTYGGIYTLYFDNQEKLIKQTDSYCSFNTVRPVFGEPINENNIKEIVIITGDKNDSLYIDDNYVGMSPHTAFLPYGTYKILAVRNDSTNSYVSNKVLKSVKISEKGGYFVRLDFRKREDVWIYKLKNADISYALREFNLGGWILSIIVLVCVPIIIVLYAIHRKVKDNIEKKEKVELCLGIMFFVTIYLFVIALI